MRVLAVAPFLKKNIAGNGGAFKTPKGVTKWR